LNQKVAAAKKENEQVVAENEVLIKYIHNLIGQSVKSVNK
jgi:cell division protein FtsB